MTRPVTSTPKTSPHHNAFPQVVHDEDGPIDWAHGLTKREYFAVQAMNAYIIADGYNSAYRGTETDNPEEVADMAIDYADALIERLNRR